MNTYGYPINGAPPTLTRENTLAGTSRWSIKTGDPQREGCALTSIIHQ